MQRNLTTRRNFLRGAGLGPAALTLGAAPARKTGNERPNIVLIMADDLGYETLGCYGGSSYRTPNLDRLAHRGVRFTHAYAQPLCTPTRVQLMTGKYNFRNWKAFGVLDPKERTFGHVMREAGYKTCIAGKWQLYSYNPPDFEPEWRGKGMRAEDSGFDEYCLWHAEHTEDKGSRYADPVVLQNGKYRDDLKGKYGPDVYAAYITDFMERCAREPFFVYYPMCLTHAPFVPTPRSKNWKTGDRLKADPGYFGDMVEYMDAVAGRIVDKVDKLGLLERTLILFFGDNGSPREIRSHLGERVVQGGKGFTTDAGTRVPLIAYWKDVTPAGRVLEDLIDSTDFFPTVAAAGGAPLPRSEIIDGRSFLPQLRGETGNPREWVFFHYDPRPGWDKRQYSLKRFARGRRYKLYSDGRLFDVPGDVLEQNPIRPGAGVPEAERARRRLQAVLDSLK